MLCKTCVLLCKTCVLSKFGGQETAQGFQVLEWESGGGCGWRYGRRVRVEVWEESMGPERRVQGLGFGMAGAGSRAGWWEKAREWAWGAGWIRGGNDGGGAGGVVPSGAPAKRQRPLSRSKEEEKEEEFHPAARGGPRVEPSTIARDLGRSITRTLFTLISQKANAPFPGERGGRPGSLSRQIP